MGFAQVTLRHRSALSTQRAKCQDVTNFEMVPERERKSHVLQNAGAALHARGSARCSLRGSFLPLTLLRA